MKNPGSHIFYWSAVLPSCSVLAFAAGLPVLPLLGVVPILMGLAYLGILLLFLWSVCSRYRRIVKLEAERRNDGTDPEGKSRFRSAVMVFAVTLTVMDLLFWMTGVGARLNVTTYRIFFWLWWTLPFSAALTASVFPFRTDGLRNAASAYLATAAVLFVFPLLFFTCLTGANISCDAATPAEVGWEGITSFMPESAQDIHIEGTTGRFRFSCTVSEQDFLDWVKSNNLIVSDSPDTKSADPTKKVWTVILIKGGVVYRAGAQSLSGWRKLGWS